MPQQRQANAVRLSFSSADLVLTNLSGAAFTATPGQQWLWVAGDEASGLTRLRQLKPTGGQALHFGESKVFALADVLSLPGAADDEADLEGLAFHDGLLWMAGSHGLKRKAAKGDKDNAENAKRLSKTPLDANRRLLACVPMGLDDQGCPTLVREDAAGRRARSLRGDAKGNQLTKVLDHDPHIGPFMTIPGKDNGLDIEGLALFGKHLLLGLRGPVLRGLSVVLEVAVAPRGVDELELVPLDDQGTLVRKHFLALDGLGVRDLHFDGPDLFILAGPTMVLDGDVRLFKWAGAGAALAACTEPAVFHPAPTQSNVLPHRRGSNKAEAFCAVPGRAAAWLVLYDAPGPDRREGETTVFGDLLLRSV
jgi:hypothetical protein